MAKIYAYLIQKNLKTMEDVPEKLVAQVREILAGMGIEVDA